MPKPRIRAQVDGLKTQLGLPPHIGVVIEDPLLDRFNLVDTAIVPLQDEVSDLGDVVGAVNELILESVTFEQQDDRRVASLQWSDELSERLQQLVASVDRIKNLRDRLSSENMAQARVDIDRLEKELPKRRATLERLREKYPLIINDQLNLAIQQQTRIPVDIDPAILSSTRLDTISDELNQEYTRLRGRFESYEQPIQALRGKAATHPGTGRLAGGRRPVQPARIGGDLRDSQTVGRLEFGPVGPVTDSGPRPDRVD